jgi:hypothetical protein
VRTPHTTGPGGRPRAQWDDTGSRDFVPEGSVGRDRDEWRAADQWQFNGGHDGHRLRDGLLGVTFFMSKMSPVTEAAGQDQGGDRVLASASRPPSTGLEGGLDRRRRRGVFQQGTRHGRPGRCMAKPGLVSMP